MNKHSPKDAGQLGFHALLTEAEAANAVLRLQQKIPCLDICSPFMRRI